ncbi:nicotinate phosphoribosyltransferase, partial [Tulasnella sp. 419]
GYETVHRTSWDLWEDVYPPEPSNALHIALTDTFTSAAFFKDLIKNQPIARRWKGVRQDSGDPFGFIVLAAQAYENMGIDPKTKTIVFSDNLNVDVSTKIKAACDDAGFMSTFGIGTFLTNDFTKASSPNDRSKPLNIVIKLRSINDIPCVKISDDLTKNTGEEEAVRFVKKIFGLPLS